MTLRRAPVPGRRQLLQLLAASAALGPTAFARRVSAAEGAKLRIGMIGSGRVGGALGRTWARAGHMVMFASRDLEHDKSLAAEVGGKAQAGTPQQAAAFAEVLVFAVPYRALPELGKSLGTALQGKIAIDACNPFPERDGPVATEAREKGVGVMSAQLLPGARIVRAFNAIGAERMGRAYEHPGAIGMPMAGDDKQAIEIASRLIRDVGFEPVLVGGLAKANYLMPGTPLAGEHPPQELRALAAKL